MAAALLARSAVPLIPAHCAEFLLHYHYKQRPSPCRTQQSVTGSNGRTGDEW
jgi:hypothetical protein